MTNVDKLPEGWRESTLGEVTEYINRGVAPKYSDTGIIVINQRCIREGKILLDNSRITDPLLRKIPEDKLIQSWDIVVCSTGTGTLGRVAQAKEILNRATVDSHVTIVRGSIIINKLFLGYYLKCKQKDIEKLAEGSTGQTELPRRKLMCFPINLPTQSEQKAIAKVLSSFDNKIELLQEQNKTLEETAQCIFKEWFGKYQIGDELPEGWRVGKLGEVVEIKRGGSPRPIKDFIVGKGLKWLKISDATKTNYPYIFDIKESIREEGINKTVLLKAGELVLSNSATPGIPKILAIDSCIHDGWLYFLNSAFSKEFLFLLFKDIRPLLLQQGNGSVFTNLKTDILKNFNMFIPEKAFLEDLNLLIKPIFNKIFNNSTQIEELKNTRDTLLPKLMSGNIRVKGFN